jgi:hypothetical protein
VVALAVPYRDPRSPDDAPDPVSVAAYFAQTMYEAGRERDEAVRFRKTTRDPEVVKLALIVERMHYRNISLLGQLSALSLLFKGLVRPEPAKPLGLIGHLRAWWRER